MTRTFLIIFIAAMLAASAAAQDAFPRFAIERIEVRGAKRVSPDVIVAESRLREGQEYTEAELSDAATRLNRLPFLLWADFALEKGSERGRHALVITVMETKPVFYLLDMRPILSDSGGPDELQVDAGDRLGDENQGVLGARWFVGRRGAFHAGLFARDDEHDFTQDYSAVVVGYTQYDLFGTRAFATINLKWPILDVANAALSPQLVVGVPVSPNQTVTLTYDETRSKDDPVTIANFTAPRQHGERLVSVRWSYDTTNDPFTPTRGTRVSATPLVAWRDTASFVRVATGPGGPNTPPPFEYRAAAMHTNSYGLSLDAAHYMELSERNSVSFATSAGLGRIQRRDSVFEGANRSGQTHYFSAQVGYSRSLWTRDAQKRGDSRLEYTLRSIRRERSENAITMYDEHDLQGAFAWVRRSSFGTIRLGVGFGW